DEPLRSDRRLGLDLLTGVVPGNRRIFGAGIPFLPNEKTRVGTGVSVGSAHYHRGKNLGTAGGQPPRPSATAGAHHLPPLLALFAGLRVRRLGRLRHENHYTVGSVQVEILVRDMVCAGRRTLFYRRPTGVAGRPA